MYKHSRNTFSRMPDSQGLYDPSYEHDACGVGFAANIDGLKSHAIIEKGIKILKNLSHRGAIGGDLKTGDGAGILFQIPDGFFRKKCEGAQISLPPAGEYGVGMIFMPRSLRLREIFSGVFEDTVVNEGLEFLGWREVPVCQEAIEGQARERQPVILQCFLHGRGLEGAALERRLYVVRRQIEKRVMEHNEEEPFYIPSLSCRTIVYKGLFTAAQLPAYYTDLNDRELVSAIAVVHQRYSTNTFPSWELAQPFRYLAHNGEINTLRGNLNLIRARESSLESELFGRDIKKLLPIIQEGFSDSSCLDNALELLTNGGQNASPFHAHARPGGVGRKIPHGTGSKRLF